MFVKSKVKKVEEKDRPRNGNFKLHCYYWFLTLRVDVKACNPTFFYSNLAGLVLTPTRDVFTIAASWPWFLPRPENKVSMNKVDRPELRFIEYTDNWYEFQFNLILLSILCRREEKLHAPRSIVIHAAWYLYASRSGLDADLNIHETRTLDTPVICTNTSMNLYGRTVMVGCHEMYRQSCKWESWVTADISAPYTTSTRPSKNIRTHR